MSRAARETAYRFPVPAAQRLASLIGMKSDLEQVVAYCDRMVKRYAGLHLKQSPFNIVGFTTPLQLYPTGRHYQQQLASAMRGASRFLRPQTLDNNLLSTADIELSSLHSFVLDFRDKHIAHSVNSFENNSVTIHIGEHFQSSTEIETITPSHTRATGLSIDVPPKAKAPS